MTFRRSTLLVALAVMTLTCGCVLSEDGRSALVVNHTSEPVVITYIQDPAYPQSGFDAPLDAGQGAMLIRPFAVEWHRLVGGCLPGTLIATTEGGRHVAEVTGLCDGGRWDIQE